MKIRYSTWKKDKLIAVNSLRFDPQNPRIQGVDGGEKKVIEELAATEDLKGLMSKMFRSGVAPVERLVVAYDGNTPIVIEGNRRLAVYKMLLDPKKAPKSLEASIKKLVKELGSEIPRKLGCDVAPDAAEANIYSYMKHADDKLYRPWAPIQQAAVDVTIADRMDDGELTERVLSPAKIKEARCMLQLYKLAGELSLRKGSSIKQENLRSFPYEAVKRVFLAKEVGEEIGIKATRSGFTITGPPEDFSTFVEATFKRMGNRATREFNTVDDALDWVKEYGYKPNGEKITLDDVLSRSANDKEDADEPEALSKTSPRSSPRLAPRIRTNKLFPEKIILPHDVPKLRDVLDEVESLNVQKHPNACGIMLRVVLELAVDEGLKKRRKLSSYQASLRQNKDALSRRIQFIKEEKIFSERELTRLLDQLKQVDLDTMNGWVHSSWCQTVGDDARKKAYELTPLINALLVTD